MKQFYKGFDLISISDIPDCESKGLYLRHRKTGLEIFHLLNNDEENLFAFAFRTPVADSTGAPHILEHSVFCGSEKFPVKEPFVNLMNQSVYTFLNAMTYPDKTVYPASSANEKDYFHLMDVYADAVFFPLLKKETFYQEGHRLEEDGKGGYSIQGVVYNEMKGNYSSFNSVAFDEQFKSLFPGTCYANDSGGDPLVIPSFTYERFKDFHRSYYSPANCLLFLYGNIKTETQLDFMQQSFFERLEKIYPIPDVPKNFPAFGEKFRKLEEPKAMSEEAVVYAAGPASDAKKSNVTLNWRYGLSSNIDDTMEVIFLMQLLAGNDSSPVAKTLSDSHLGERLVAGGGAEAFCQMLYFGLSGVDKKNADAVKKLIIFALADLCENGIPKNDIDAAVLAVDFANREVVRVRGDPFSLELADRALNGWNYGASPASTLGYRTAFDTVKRKIAADKNYIASLIRRVFLDNTARSFVVVTPEASFLKQRAKKESELIASLAKDADAGEVRRNTEALHAYQKRKETEKETACIPHILPSDLKKKVEPIVTDVSSCLGADGSDVALFVNREATGGIVYIDVCCPADALPIGAYPYIPAFAACATNTGWNGKKWDECAAAASLCSGDMGVRTLTGDLYKSAYAKKATFSVRDKHYIGRDWLSFSIKLPVEKTDEALSLFAEAIAFTEFSDTERVKTILDEMKNDIRSSVIPSGSRYAKLRASRNLGRSSAVEETWGGVTQVLAIEKICKENSASLGARFSDMAKSIRNAGGLIHITADDASLKTVLPRVPEFARKAGLHALFPLVRPENGEYYALTKALGEKDDERFETCALSSQVGYAAQSVYLGGLTMREKAALTVLCHWMRGNILWERIRTTGGAYGASAGFDISTEIFSMTTYRDPSPLESIKTFKSCLDDVCAMRFSDTDVSRAVTGTYGDVTKPQSPQSRGARGFLRKLYAMTHEEWSDYIEAILSVDAASLHTAAEKARAIAEGNTALICDKSVKGTGFIIDLSL